MLANDNLKEKKGLIKQKKSTLTFKDCNVHFVKIEHYEVILLREYDFECLKCFCLFEVLVLLSKGFCKPQHTFLSVAHCMLNIYLSLSEWTLIHTA